MKTDVFRDGKVHIQKRMCNTCIFRAGNPMHLEDGRVDGMVETCIAEQGVIPCHKRLDTPGQAVCRGFFDNHHASITGLLLARHMGNIEEVTICGNEPPDHE